MSCPVKKEDFLGYYPQNEGNISDSITQNWTEQAIECFNVNHNCKKCSLSGGNYSFVCQMPKVVRTLLKLYGEPQIQE